jgi:YD repeat-containing protein
VSLVTSTRVKDGAGNIIAQTSINYDEGSDGSWQRGESWTDPGNGIPRGNATTTSRWLNTTNSYLLTHATYDKFGNVRTTIDAKGNQSSVDCSSNYQYAYPTTRTTAIPDSTGAYGSNTALSATTSYDFNIGLVLSQTDVNGQQTSMAYNDALNRLTQVSAPDGQGTARVQDRQHNETA